MDRFEKNIPLQRGQVLLMAFLLEGGILLLWVFLSHLLGMPTHEQGQLTFEAFLQGAAGTVPMLLFLWLLAHSAAPPIRRLVDVVDRLVVPVLRPLTITDYVLVALLAGVGEEGLFRGVLQGYLEGMIGTWPAIVTAAAVFGLLHYITPLYALLAGIMGLYLGWLYASAGNLLVPMIVHGLYDFVALVYLVKIRKQNDISGSGERREG